MDRSDTPMARAIRSVVEHAGSAGLSAPEAMAAVPEASERTVRTLLSRCAVEGRLYAVGYRETRRYFARAEWAQAYHQANEDRKLAHKRQYNRERMKRHYTPPMPLAYKAPPWTEEQLAALRALYPHHPAPVVARTIGRAVFDVYKKAGALQLRKAPRPPKPPAPPKIKRTRAAHKRPAMTDPNKALPARQDPGPVRIARSASRGPAHLEGPLIFTAQTRHVVCPSPPRALRTNTHSAW